MAEHSKDVENPERGFIKNGDKSDDGGFTTDNESTLGAQKYAYSEDRKIGITGSVFLILNKMIGTGSR